MEEHLQFPFGKPYAPLWTLRKPYEIELLKVITKNDELIVLSNYSFRVFIFNSKNRLMKKFSIFTDEVKENYENLIKIAKEKENEAGKRAKNFWSWAILFYPLCIDSDNNICFPLNKENGEKCIYKYTFSGLKLERIICPRSAPWDEIIFNNKKDLIFISKKGIQIGIYREYSINRRLK